MAVDQFGLTKTPSIGSQFISGATSALNPASLGLSLAGKALSGIGNALGIGKPDKDPGRIASNFKWYQAALAGDMWSYRQLSCMAGDQTYKAQQVNDPNGSCGWATKSTQDDAKRLLNDLQARGIGTTSGQNAGNGATLGTSPMPTTGNGAVMVSQAGMFPTPAGLGGSWLLLIVSFAAVVYFRPKN